MLEDQMSKLYKKEKVEENLFVKNIIVNKDKRKKQYLPFIATEKWIDQLGNRLQICLLYTSPSPRDSYGSRMPSSA